MGKTVPSYRIALEFEIEQWKSFRKALISAEDKEAFDVLMDMCRENAMASGAACNPIIFEPMIMSILMAHQSKLSEFENKLHEIFWLRSSAQTTKNLKQPENLLENTCKPVDKQILGGLRGHG